MRASTLFAITIAVLLGLGLAIAAKVSGVFDRPPPAEAKKPDAPAVLVPTRNLFAGDVIRPGDVQVRQLREDELAEYRRDPKQYLPPVREAAFYRFTAQNIQADEPLLQRHLQEITKPEALNMRLVPGTRAVNLSVTKEHSVGGMIQVGEWVDVYLTTSIERPDESVPSTRTANIARSCRVIAKRDTLWPTFAPIPEDKPVHFTLEMNCYRAALIEYCKTKGVLSLVPLPAGEQRHLEAKRQAALKSNGTSSPAYFSDPESTEYANEDMRVAAFNGGSITIGDDDLVRIFGLKPLSRPVQVAVEQYTGVNRRPSLYFWPDSRRGPVPGNTDYSYRFRIPAEPKNAGR
ncbi:MAG: Flp pilus assembly protein CpaB [Gemmataceae bacterium]|nr:Flp pilus assembly protein CpaB [Gemmataceae bacterium]MDW8264905.1 Flp pilus assembly protein CpaB [Gemmataceae bacterium]